MIKKVMGVIGVVAVCAVAGWNYQQSEQEVELSDLALANVEALAIGEGTIQDGCEYKAGSTCTEIIIFPDGSTGDQTLYNQTKKPGWI